MRIRFGPFAFDLQSRLLWRDGVEVPLPPRVLGVLEALIERPGDVIARQDLLDRVWKDAFVTDTSLAEAVSTLRQALGDDPQSPTYVQTVHRRGYRFVAPIAESDQGQTGGKQGSDWGQTRVRDASDPSLTPFAESAPRTSQLLPWTIAIFATALAGSAIWNGVRKNAIEPAPITRFDVRPSAGSWFDRRAPAFAASRDGRAIAWAACEGVSGTCGLFVRPVDRLDPVRLAGTDGAEAPFFSPDGRWLAFFADGKLKKVAVSGGSPLVLADAPAPGGGSWNDEGEIVFSGLPAGGLAITSDQGGEMTAVTTPQAAKGELRHAWPSWMPGNRAILFTIVTSPVPGAPGRLALKNVGAPTWRTLRTGVSRAIPAGPGYLLVESGSDLRALTYDERTLALTGSSDAVFDALADANGVAQFAAANGGTLVALRSPSAERTVEWNDAPGRPLQNAARLEELTLSTDGRRGAGVIADATGSDIWTVDLDTDALARVTFGGTNASPAWAPDGQLVYAARKADGPFTIPAAGSIRADGHLFPAAVAANGRIAALEATKDGHTSLVIIAPDGIPQTIVGGPVDVMSAAFSPDGRSIAYDSDETGRREIYVRRTDSTARTQLSTAGGECPSWSADGRTIFFHEGARFVRLAVDANGQPRADSRTVVLDLAGARAIGVTPDGRVLAERRPLPLEGATVVLQWLRELQQRSPLPVNAPR
jgi:DNA-binding winged helix-turn-helix (wHTH) protein/Tol biopolymer transport system component